jgi:hypothetical protein
MCCLLAHVDVLFTAVLLLLRYGLASVFILWKRTTVPTRGLMASSQLPGIRWLVQRGRFIRNRKCSNKYHFSEISLPREILYPCILQNHRSLAPFRITTPLSWMINFNNSKINSLAPFHMNANRSQSVSGCYRRFDLGWVEGLDTLVADNDKDQINKVKIVVAGSMYKRHTFTSHTTTTYHSRARTVQELHVRFGRTTTM